MEKWFRKYFGCCRKLHLNWFRQTLSFTEREYLSSRFSMLTNSLKISDTTKTKFFEQKLFQSDQKPLQNYCRLDLDSVMDPLTCWLYISVLTQGFLGIQLTTLFAVYNFGNKSAMTLISFFPKCQKFDENFRHLEKIEKMFWVFEKISFELISLNTHYYREITLVIGNQYVNK